MTDIRRMNGCITVLATSGTTSKTYKMTKSLFSDKLIRILKEVEVCSTYMDDIYLCTELTNWAGVAHVSFFNEHAETDAAARESIELRAFVFFCD